ncbi:MAG: hypothetical protein AAB380_06185 [Verrucomicrobiota bacterium]
MALSYNQIGNELRERKRKLTLAEQTCRAFVQKAIERLKEELGYPDDAITFYKKTTDGVYVLAGDLDQIHLFSDGYFHVGLGIEYRSPANDGVHDKVLLKLKLGQVGDGIDASIEGTPIKGKMPTLRDGEAFIGFVHQLATLLGEIYSKEFEAFLSGKRDEQHPAHETAKRLIQNHIDEQYAPRLQKAA